MSQDRTVDEPSSQVDTLALSLISGIGPITQRRLADRFGNASNALDASLDQLCEVEGVGRELARRIRAGRSREAARAEIARCHAAQITLLTYEEDDYPVLLREIPDPPQALHCRGERLADASLALAIVGTRHPTPYGCQQAQRLAAALSRAGFAIVSGLARGIDATVHRATLDAGGRTVAVLATGVEMIYPPQHVDLAAEIVHHGTLVSEITGADAPRRGAFPRRNRIITGLSLGVVVVEASLRSGALVSARHAAEQGRDVFVVPGRADSVSSAGCHQLIRDGAILVTQPEHILEALGPLAQPVVLPEGRLLQVPRELQLNPQESQVLEAIPPGGLLIDEVVRATGLPTGRVLSTLNALEIRHLVRREPGSRVVRY
ncbi:MAG: DNA-processing protein DprA [Planctomycetota bacterium]|nr:DNA-processing protein DprA [Planctomycetota bacterium]MDA1177520.1 DNA-processing protein DprA [Planctomycetota bacterium]